MNAPSRIHALDNLRAMLMWLGIVLHVAVNHMATPTMPWRDSQSSPAADLIVLLIHSFRMPAFYILAGFFVARMLEERGRAGMLKNRARRIGLPFVIFWPILFVCVSSLIVIFAHLMQRGTIGFDLTLLPKREPHQTAFNTMHLWFLYDLLWLCLLAAVASRLGQYLPHRVLAAARSAAGNMLATWWGTIVLAIPVALIGTAYPHGILAPSGSFVPNLAEIADYGLFFAAGATVYWQRHDLLPQLERRCWRNGIAGLVAFILSLVTLKAGSAADARMAYPDLGTALFFGCTNWLWSLAVLGFFSRYLPRQNRVLKYLSDSSYWVYLVHLAGTIGFGILLYDAPFGVAGKMLLNISATTAVCLLSYHWLVRNSWIGVLLNGRRARDGSPASIGLPQLEQSPAGAAAAAKTTPL
ncbi:acyltransferase family protein [Massilia rhizosphaerae]|uniref:acyltransferase family protein n=1 Tax=Massilia rhizosphaerae TaxID=2784389 RepID=UPI00351D5E52